MKPDQESISPEAAGDLHEFRKSLPLQVRLHEIVRAMGSVDGLDCLEIGSENGTMSYHLRQRGGKWHTVTRNDALAEHVRAVVPNDVHAMAGNALPFKKKVFDVVVVSDFLESVPDADAFVEDCHRILKPDGRLIINAVHSKPATLLGPFRSVLGVNARARGLVRDGYTESELFALLKHGFNVLNVRSYSRFFVEMTDAWVRCAVRKLGRPRGAGYRRLLRLYTFAGLAYSLAGQLDLLLFWTRGHALIAVAKRRAWRPRNAPVLSDGRSISEAVLSKALQ
jgi:SAM-dependent methyltransferase